MNLTNKQLFIAGLFFGFGLAIAKVVVELVPTIISALGGK